VQLYSFILDDLNWFPKKYDLGTLIKYFELASNIQHQISENQVKKELSFLFSGQEIINLFLCVSLFPLFGFTSKNELCSSQGT
jgi:hypothetical protein